MSPPRRLVTRKETELPAPYLLLERRGDAREDVPGRQSVCEDDRLNDGLDRPGRVLAHDDRAVQPPQRPPVRNADVKAVVRVMRDRQRASACAARERGRRNGKRTCEKRGGGECRSEPSSWISFGAGRAGMVVRRRHTNVTRLARSRASSRSAGVRWRSILRRSSRASARRNRAQAIVARAADRGPLKERRSGDQRLL